MKFCPFCKAEGKLTKADRTYHRGERFIVVKTPIRTCPNDCVGPAGQVPFKWHIAADMRGTDKAARDAWLIKYGTDMPVSRRRKRKKGKPK